MRSALGINRITSKIRLSPESKLTILEEVGGSREEAVLRTSTKENRIGKPFFRVSLGGGAKILPQNRYFASTEPKQTESGITIVPMVLRHLKANGSKTVINLPNVITLFGWGLSSDNLQTELL